MNKPQNQANPKLKSNQSGSVLIVSLLILLVLTVIGTTSLNETVMEEKMASNFQKGNIAFQAAESAINNTFIKLSQSRDLVEQAETVRPVIDEPDQNWPRNEDCILANGSVCDPEENTTHYNTGEKVMLDTEVRHVGYIPQARTRAGSSFEIMDSNTPAADIVDIVATGNIANNNVTRSQLQGATKLRPGSGQAK
ncbi:MAG: pilus assembly PilX N-terminal domain-containing protein [Gammaproteobacteria bacterium]|jgi:Tfp pilus assembly protein PilX